MRRLILCLGNELAGDDGAGIYIAKKIKGKLKNCDVKESNASGIYLIEEMEGYDDVLIVDTIIGEPEGEIVMGEIKGEAGRSFLHGLSLAQALLVGRAFGLKLPEKIKFIGIKISMPVFSTEISDVVRESADRVIEFLIFFDKEGI